LTEENNDLIKIEVFLSFYIILHFLLINFFWPKDLLPYFNDNIKISQFKDEICKSLQEYNVKIENLKQEMKGLK
jgi:hypothetical protein